MEEKSIIITKDNFKFLCKIFFFLLAYEIIEGLLRRETIEIKYFMFDFLYTCFAYTAGLFIFGLVYLYKK